MRDLHQQHRIRAWLRGDLPSTPPEFNGRLAIGRREDGSVVIETPGELSPLLGWLATLPLEEVKIEPVGLRAIYDRYHSDESVV
jgi:ABC-2 type transport system ATP-binding protein